MTEASGSPVIEIRPTPTDEEAAAIAATVELVLPRVAVGSVTEPPPRWRFAGRRWSKPTPVRRDRPW